MTYGEMRKILAAVGARGDGRFTLKRAYGNDFCLNPRDDAGLEWEVELIDWRRGFRAHPAAVICARRARHGSAPRPSQPYLARGCAPPQLGRPTRPRAARPSPAAPCRGGRSRR